MKKLLFVLSLAICLLSVPLTGMAAQTEEQQEYEEAITDNLKEMLKGSIALDKISAENKSYQLKWLEAEQKPEDAKTIAEKIKALESEQKKEQESMDPYNKAIKSCEKKLNADGANAALENVIRIQRDRIEDQEELLKLWKKIDRLLK